MDPIIVRRHGSRWSVQDDPDTAPPLEYETRELAEVAARDLAQQSGREVVVHDDQAGDNESSEASQSDPGGHTVAGTNVGVPDEEAPREPQAGL